ncbi:MAG: hypothetical protein ABFD60_12415 [Bryobacteraceae bacterium]
MKSILIVFLILVSGALAAEKPKTGAKSSQAAQAITLPAGAKEVEANVWRYTDDKGKVWIYRRTPFGLSRFEETAASKDDDIAPSNMKAVEEGDSIRFERPTPFGTARWVRKKSELNDVERAAWERELRRSGKTSDAKPGSSQTSGKQER